MKNFPIVMVVLAVVFGVGQILLGPGEIDLLKVTDGFLSWLLFFSVGIQGLWAFTGHVFFSELVAAHIGWDPSPFQFEVGVANLGIGVVGVLCPWTGFGFQAAAALVASCFLLGAAVGHVRQMMERDNFAPGNAGPIFYTDIGVPLVLLSLLFLRAFLS